MAKTLWKTRTTRLDAQSQAQAQAQAQETVPPLTAEPLGRNLPALEPTLAPTPVVEPAVQRPGADPARPAVGAVPEGIAKKPPLDYMRVNSQSRKTYSTLMRRPRIVYHPP